jgi:hypothetical protein
MGHLLDTPAVSLESTPSAAARSFKYTRDSREFLTDAQVHDCVDLCSVRRVN